MIRASRETWVVFAIATLNSVGWSATMPFLAVYLSSVRHVSLATIGLVYLAAGLMSLASQLAGGRLTDSMGPKRVMLIGYFFSVVSALLLSYLIGVDADTNLILVAYPAFNFLRGLAQPSASAIVANNEIQNLQMGLSLLSIAGNLGFAIGPALGGILAQSFNYASVFLLSAAVPVVSSAIVVAYVKGGRLRELGLARTRRTSLSLNWRTDRNLILFLLLTFCGYIAIGYEVTPVSIYVQNFLNFSPAEIGYLFATNGAVIVVLQLPLSAYFFRARMLVYPIIAACGFAALSFVAGALSTTFLEWELMMVILTLGEIFITVPSQTVLTVFSSAESRGTFQGYFSASSIGGRSLAALVGLYSFQFFGSNPGLGWYAIAGFSALLALGFGLLAEPLQKDYSALRAEAGARSIESDSHVVED